MRCGLALRPEYERQGALWKGTRLQPKLLYAMTTLSYHLSHL